MHIDRAGLEARFRDLSDEELSESIESGVLTELAAEVARAEAASRGPKPLAGAGEIGAAGADSLPAHGALRVCATFLNPIVAEALSFRLLAEGLVPQTHYANGGVLGNVGLAGVRVMVPESQLEDAMRIRAAFDAGEYAIDDDFDVDQ
jgi:hypothetical protein